MSMKGQTLEPPRSDLSDPLRNNSFKSLKTSEYESKIYELSNQVKILREKLIEMEQSKHSELAVDPPLAQRNAELQKYVALLREDNDALRKENLLLRDRIKNLEGMIGKRKHHNNQNRDKIELASVKSMRSLQYSPRGRASEVQPNLATNKNSVQLSSATSVTTNLMRELLAECNEPNECLGNRQSKREKDEFYQFKNTQDCFQPFFSSLNKELKIRLKRCLLKQKELLLVDSNIELGVISPYKVSSQDSPQLTKLMIVVTNIGLHPITNLTLQYLYSNDITITSKGTTKHRTSFAQSIRNNEQIKQQLQVTVNSIDFQCVKVTLNYQTNKEKHSQLLILPLSKSKLFRDLPFTSAPLHTQKVQRVFQYERKILSELGKLKSFFPHAYESKEKNGSPKFSWKLQFMGRPFWISAQQVEQKLALSVTYESQRPLAQKILGELVFLFQRI